MEKKTKYVPFGVFDYEYMESWLEDMAAQGFRLVSMSLCFATFVKTEAQNLRYRIIPQPAGKTGDEETGFYEAHGWDFVAASRGLSVFCSSDPDAEELFTDYRSYSQRTRSFMIWCIIGVAAFAYLGWTNFDNYRELMTECGGILHLINEVGLIYFISFCMIGILAICLSLTIAVRYGMLAARLKRGIHRTKLPFRIRCRMNKVVAAAVCICVAALPAGELSGHVILGKTTYPGLSDNHPVSLEKLDGAFYNKVNTALEDEEWPEEIGCWADQYSNGLFSVVNEVYAGIEPTESGTLTETDEYRYFYAIYYEARSKQIAKKFMEEELQQNREREVARIKEFNGEYNGIDQGYYIIDEDGYQRLLVRSGSRMETVIYYGETDVEIKTDEVIYDILH